MSMSIYDKIEYAVGVYDEIRDLTDGRKFTLELYIDALRQLEEVDDSFKDTDSYSECIYAFREIDSACHDLLPPSYFTLKCNVENAFSALRTIQSYTTARQQLVTKVNSSIENLEDLSSKIADFIEEFHEKCKED